MHLPLHALLRNGLASLCLVAAAAAQERPITGKDVIPDGPDWIRHAVVYQIYPQTYYDSNGDGIGDLRGITEKLDYIKSLGVDAIWLNPFFDSPFNDAGYDIRDYFKVAPRYGTNDDARRLFAEAHRRGIRVLFDFVSSYTSIDNPWFTASALQKPSATSNWYVWTDNVWKFEPENGFVHGYGQRNGNFLSNFFWNEPALNYGYGRPDPDKPWQLSTRHPDVLALREEMKKVVRFWMDMGADGFRADMAGALVKGGDPDRRTQAFWRRDPFHPLRKLSAGLYGRRVVGPRGGARRGVSRKLLPLVGGVQRPLPEGGLAHPQRHVRRAQLLRRRGQG